MIFFSEESVFGQKFRNVRANYKNDTLSIHYDLVGNERVDSIIFIITSYQSKKQYNFCFQGDTCKAVKAGTGKRVWAVVPRDSFPENGESIRIMIRGWTKSTSHSKKRRKLSAFEFKNEQISNPRFSLSAMGGVLFPRSEYSDLGYKASALFYYNPKRFFQIGLGTEYYHFKDSIKQFSTLVPLISNRINLTDYKIPLYFTGGYGYCITEMNPVLSFGLGFEKSFPKLFNIDVNLVLTRFTGSKSFHVFGLNAGFSINASERKRIPKEKLYKFQDISIYLETGTNILQKAAPSFSAELAYNFSPFYCQSVGIAFERFKYQGKDDLTMSYYSSFYKKRMEYIYDQVIYNLEINLVPIYLSGRLFFGDGKYRPFCVWKYGFSVWSDADKGEIQNGFIAGLGFGIQVFVKKRLGFTLSCGFNYFENQYKIETYSHKHFGSAYLKAGFVF